MASGILGSALTAVKYIPTPLWQNGMVEGLKAGAKKSAAYGVGPGAIGAAELAANALAAGFEVHGIEKSEAAINPHFKDNGHDGPSPNTIDYLTKKLYAKRAASIVTNLADITGWASGAQAAASSIAWYRINALFEQMVPPARRAKKAEYAHWYSYQVAKKAVPPGSLEVQMTRILRQKMYSAAGGATKAGIALGTEGLAGYFVNSAASMLQGHLDAMFGQDTQTLAKGLHWYAFLETVVGRGRAEGPARRILKILWLEFGIARASGITLDQVVAEPCGWLVIADFIE